MQIVELKKPKLKSVHMTVDTIIDPKLEEFPAIKTLFGTSSTTLICGGTGSGKTTFVVQMMKSIFKKVFHNIYLIIPENSLNSISEKDNVFKKYLDPECIYHTYDVETLQEIYEKVNDDAADGYFSLLIIDDMGAALKNKHEAKILQSLFLKNRHLRLSVMLLAQAFFMVPKVIREISNNAIIFNTSKSQSNKFFTEVLDLTKQQFQQLMRLCPSTHDSIMVSLKRHKIYKDYNEIQFTEPEDDSAKS